MLGTYLEPLRGARGVLCWDNIGLTSWLSMALLVVAAVLPLLPWLLLVRLLGFTMLGPHMWCARATAQAAAQATTSAYRSAHGVRLMAAADGLKLMA